MARSVGQRLIDNLEPKAEKLYWLVNISSYKHLHDDESMKIFKFMSSNNDTSQDLMAESCPT
jgi:hypothetical protein